MCRTPTTTGTRRCTSPLFTATRRSSSCSLRTVNPGQPLNSPETASKPLDRSYTASAHQTTPDSPHQYCTTSKPPDPLDKSCTASDLPLHSLSTPDQSYTSYTPQKTLTAWNPPDPSYTGADVRAKTDLGVTPLHLATSRHHGDVPHPQPSTPSPKPSTQNPKSKTMKL